MQQPITHSMRSASLFMRTIAATVVVTFSMLILTPAAAAARSEAHRLATEKSMAPNAEHQLDQRVQEVQTRLTQLEAKLAAGKSAETERKELRQLRQEIEALDQKVTANFQAVGARLRAKQVPEVILQRQREAEAKYRSKLNALLSTLHTVDTAKDDATRAQAADQELTRLKVMKHHPARRRFDPNHLPNRSRRPDKNNRPKTHKRQFVTAGLINNPPAKYASLGNYDYSGLAGASDPAYLAADSEVTLTPAIKAEASALGNDPVRIYNWVRNNVQWIPSWGAMQDADTTLGSLRGNAFDISALTIALLRASGIPARFVHGTIDVPAAQFMNWAGGFSNITEAANYASSGGIPITSFISGGQITKIRMEHIWVEAAIDYYPSRGAVMHSANAWVAMDPSFKQYQFKQGLDVASITGIDPKTLITSFSQSGTVNDTDGWVQGLDPSILQNAQSTAQQKLNDYITNNMTNPAVGDVIGGRTIIQQNPSTLPSSLPNHIVVIGARYGTLPNSLRETMTFSLGTDILGDMINPVTLPWTELNNHKVTLSFIPATADDESALESFISINDVTDLSQLPSTIPAYLINVVPVLKVDGKVISTGSAINLGGDQGVAFQFGGPSENDTKVYEKTVVAGSYLAITSVGGSVSEQDLLNVKTQLSDIQTTLQSGDQTQISALTKEETLGDMFYAGVLEYYEQLNALSRIAAISHKSHVQLLPSAGTYGAIPKVNYTFGIPMSISAGGVEMDLNRVMTATNTDGKGQHDTSNFNIQLGVLSSNLESGIPEQMFVKTGTSGDGVSAIKAIALSEQAGQRIYHITSANMATALPNVHHSAAVMQEINDALAANEEVITHQDDITINGWTGSGYIILDPQTGMGAYKIGGGLNGGILSRTKDMLLFMASLVEDESPVIGKVGKLGGYFDFISDFVEIYNAKGCNAGDAGGGAMLMYLVGDYLAGLGTDMLAVMAIANPLLFLVMVFMIVAVISFITSLIKDGVIYICKTRSQS